MKHPGWDGGVILTGRGIIFVFNITGDYNPAAVTVLVVGIWLVGGSRLPIFKLNTPSNQEVLVSNSFTPAAARPVS
jgi:hypothetical protein